MQLDLSIDHFQFYIHDTAMLYKTYTAEIWDEAEPGDRVLVRDGFICVVTERYGGATRVEIEFTAAEPVYQVDDWETIIHCGIDITAPTMAVYSPEQFPHNMVMLDVKPGSYAVLVFFANLDSMNDEMDREGDDWYKLVFWPATQPDLAVLKQPGL